jgi:hypothetical protein
MPPVTGARRCRWVERALPRLGSFLKAPFNSRTAVGFLGRAMARFRISNFADVNYFLGRRCGVSRRPAIRMPPSLGPAKTLLHRG